MKDGPNIVGIAALIGEHARAQILMALMAGQALTATELARRRRHQADRERASRQAPRRAPARGGEPGRHRYFRLADRDVAQLLESLMGVAYRAGAVRVRSGPPTRAAQGARVLRPPGGRLGVSSTTASTRRRCCAAAARARTDAGGPTFCRDFGIDVDALAGSGARCAARASTGACVDIISPARSAPRVLERCLARVGAARQRLARRRFRQPASGRCESASANGVR